MEIIFLEEKIRGYKIRTIKNASADVTIAIAINFNSAGEKLTKQSVLFQKKKYIPIKLESLDISDELINSIIFILNSVNAKTINIAGNGIYTFNGVYTQEQIDNYVYRLLNKVLLSSKLISKIELIRTGGQCLLGDTKIPLLDGTEVEIQDLIKGQKYWIYGCNTNGKVIPVECIALGITRTEYEYCEIILDNNEVIRCTLDHKFMLRNGTYLQAKNLQINQSLMPLYRKISNSKDKIKGYEMYLDNSNNNWYFTHRLVANETKLEDYQNKKIALLNSNIEKRLVVHHIDFNKRNNAKIMNINKLVNYAVKLIELGIILNQENWDKNKPNGFPKFNNIIWIDKFESYNEFIKIVENKIKNNGLTNHKVKSVKIVKS